MYNKHQAISSVILSSKRDLAGTVRKGSFINCCINILLHCNLNVSFIFKIIIMRVSGYINVFVYCLRKA